MSTNTTTETYPYEIETGGTPDEPAYMVIVTPNPEKPWNLDAYPAASLDSFIATLQAAKAELLERANELEA